MKIVKDGRVYDMDYGAYETVARIPAGWGLNEIGNSVEVTRELRRDKASGLFYVGSHSEGYDRSRHSVKPVTRDEAARIAEDLLDYEQYVKCFGDPEGADRGLERERDDALEKAKLAEGAKDYWYGEYSKRGSRIAELEKRVAELEAAK